MSSETFTSKIRRTMLERQSLLCIGLDPMLDQMPTRDIVEFNRAIVEETLDLACAYKLNFGFYEQFGVAGWEALEATVSLIPRSTPVIADAKRADIGHTSAAYTRAIYDVLGFDACTVSPYLGGEAIQSFLDRADRTVFVLCRTSNPGSGEFQSLLCQPPDGGALRPLYQIVAGQAEAWNANDNVGLVVGATYPAELAEVRNLCPDLPILVPGVGSQAGDLEGSVRAGLGADGLNLIINVSRSVIYADRGPGFAKAARRAAERYQEAINRPRESTGAL